MPEVFLTIAIFIGLYFWNRKFSQNSGYERWEESLLHVLCGYHLLFAGVFTWYLLEYGGDAIRYWSLEANVSQNPVNWMDYWGHGTFFLQWLHFWPSKVFGLEFWFGNALYAGISWLGVREIFALMRPHLANPGNRILAASGWLILFLPNLHFWSAGIGKEALLLLGMALVMKSFSSFRSNWHWALLGLILAFWVRPVFGIVLGAIAFGFVLAGRDFGIKEKFVILLLGVLAGILGIWKVSVMMHLEEISVAAIFRFSESQFDYLAGFQAKSEIPMDEYNWLQRYWALFFRPTVWEASDFWNICAALENAIGLLWVLAGFGSFLTLSGGFSNGSVPRFLFLGFVVCLGMSVVYGLTLNNLGIIMRMKSTYMITCYYFCWVLVALRVESVSKRKQVS